MASAGRGHAVAVRRLGGHAVAVRRLMRDLRELQEHPQEGISAAPLHPETSLFLWHGTLVCASGPLAGAVMHVEMSFPEDYPDNPPNVALLSPLTGHPNVFRGGWICCDILKREDAYGRWSGWSPAYSVSSVLIQLSSFFFAERVDQEYGGPSANSAMGDHAADNVRCSRAFGCAECGHDSVVPWPPLPAPPGAAAGSGAGDAGSEAASFGRVGPGRGKESDTVSGGGGGSGEGSQGRGLLLELPAEVTELIFGFLAPRDLCAVARSSRGLLVAVRASRQWVLRELQCYRTKVSFRSDILGVGLQVSVHSAARPGAQIRTLSTPFDLLSADSFAQGCRRGVWGEKINAWIPLMIDASHKKRGARHLALCSVRHLASVHPPSHRTVNDGTGGDDSAAAGAAALAPPPVVGQWLADALSSPRVAPPALRPEEVLAVLPKLLNAQVVAMMEADRTRDSRLSEKALLGYCSFHHLFAELCASVPGVTAAAVARLDTFLAADGLGRCKKKAPDLGELLALLAVSPHTGAGERHEWARVVAKPFLQECLARNVFWLFKDQPRTLPKLYNDVLTAPADSPQLERLMDELLARSAHGSATSRRVVLFQVAFLERVARKCGATPEATVAWYEGHLGRPSADMHAALKAAARAAEKCASWEDFFSQLGLRPLPKRAMVAILLDAAKRSAALGYHRSDYTDSQQRLATTGGRGAAGGAAGGAPGGRGGYGGGGGGGRGGGGRGGPRW